MSEMKKEPVPLANRVCVLLMQAWRERWSDVQWGIELKRLLVANGKESCDLAEILLQRAMIGNSPNKLMLSYLKQTVLSQLIPCSAVFNYISTFDVKTEEGGKGEELSLQRPYSILSLLHLTEVFGTKLSFSYGPDSPLVLCSSLLRVVHWILKLLLACLTVEGGRDERPELTQVMEAASKAAIAMLKRPTVTALMHVARADNAEAYSQYEQTEINLRGTLSQLPHTAILESTRENISTVLSLSAEVAGEQVHGEAILETNHVPGQPTVNALVALEAILNPNSDVQPFVDQVLMLSRLMKVNRPQLFLEMFRACFMGLVDANNSHEELKWATFAFLKMRQIMMKIQQIVLSQDFSSGVEDFSADVVQGVDLLLQYRHLLDQADIKQRWDCLGQFLKECMQANIISDAQMNSLVAKRQAQREQLRQADLQTNSTSSAGLIARAETTVISIIKTLDADHQKNLESLVGVLSQMLTGRSFEIITSAAASMGELKNFTLKLIRSNEFARQTTGEAGRTAQIRAQLFEITFLMLCHIIQVHGMEIVAGSKDASDSFFIKWSQRWLPEDNKYRSLDIDAGPPDPAKVDNLLLQLLSGQDLRTSLQRWNEVCINIPFAVQEVLFAWEHKALSFDKVKGILDNIKSRMGCLSVVTCVWLCSYMNVVGVKAREKPLLMLEHLTKVKVEQPVSQVERPSSLMNVVMERIMNDVLPVNHPQRISTHIHVSVDMLPVVTLQKTLTDAFQRGWLTLKCIHTLEQLLTLCGADWFCEKVVLQMLEGSRTEDLSLALSLVLAVFHMDLERLTHSLIFTLMPRLLVSTVHKHLLTDPHGCTLAKLCVLCITGTQTSKIGQKEPYVRRVRKRSKMDAEMEDMEDSDMPPSKMRKINESHTPLTLNMECFRFDELTAKDDGEVSPNFDAKDPMNKALINLLCLMSSIIQDPAFTPRTTFIISFIQEASKCGTQNTHYILQFMPPKMLSYLMKSMPGVFSNSEILRICDLSTLAGRKQAAKAVCANSKFTDSA